MRAPAQEKRRLRVFKVETPVDLVLAQAVARRQAGFVDVLVTNQSNLGVRGEPERQGLFAETMRALASGHSWHRSVVMPTGTLDANTAASWWRQAQARGVAVRRVRRLVLGELATESCDEVYISCMAHPDNQIVWEAMPHAIWSLGPHNPQNFTRYEDLYYRRWFLPPGLNSRARIKRVIRRVLFGHSSSIPHFGPIARAYACRTPFQHAKETVLLPETRERPFWQQALHLLDRERVIQWTRELQGAALVLPSSVVVEPGRELPAMLRAARRVQAEHTVKTFKVKPHPAGDGEWPRRVCGALQRELVGASVSLLEGADFVPSELVALLGVAACVSWDSSSPATISGVLGVPCYSPLREVAENLRSYAGEEVAAAWLAEHRGDLIGC